MKKYYLPIDTPYDGSIPIGGIFALSRSNYDKFEVQELKGRKKIDQIIFNTYRENYLNGLSIQADHFMKCSQIASKISVYQVTRPIMPFRLEELINIIEERF
jgi:hypothetical protein